MKWHIVRTFVLLAFLLVTTGQATLPDSGTTRPAKPLDILDITPPPAVPPAKTLEFPFNENVGHWGGIYIPVKIGGGEHLFVLETSSTGIAINTKLAATLGEFLGPVLSKQTIIPHVSTGFQAELQLRRMPQLEAGGQTLSNTAGLLAVIDGDYGVDPDGKPIEGELGLSVLSNYVVRLDFRRHVVELIDPQGFQAPKKESVKAFRLSMTNGASQISTPFAGLANLPISIATSQYDFGTISNETLKKLPRAISTDPDLRTGPPPATMLPVRLQGAWSFAGVNYQRVAFERTSTDSLGLGILSDFVVTLDYPGGWAYFENIGAAHQTTRTLEFPIGEGANRGDAICIPVKIEGKDHLFMVDTGSSMTVFDSRLANALAPVLGAQITRGNTMTANGEMAESKIYHAPRLEAGGQPLINRSATVFVLDLELFREAIGRPVEGILGLDVLYNYTIRLDFRKHVIALSDRLEFARPDDKDAREFQMVGNNGGTPGILLPFAGNPETPFGIDTGDDGFGLISPATQQKISTLVTEIRPKWAADITGFYKTEEVCVEPNSMVAGTKLNKIWLTAGAFDVVGTDFLSDYMTTLDFLGHRVFPKSINTQHHPPENVSKIKIARKDNRFVVIAVSDDAHTDIQTGDEILALDGKDVAGMELWALRERLRLVQTTVVKLRRGRDAMEMPLRNK